MKTLQLTFKAWSPYSRNNRRICLRTCSKEGLALKLLTYRLRIFLVKYVYLRSLQLCEDQGKDGKLYKRVCKHVLAILTTCMEAGADRYINFVVPGLSEPLV